MHTYIQYTYKQQAMIEGGLELHRPRTDKAMAARASALKAKASLNEDYSSSFLLSQLPVRS